MHKSPILHLSVLNFQNILLLLLSLLCFGVVILPGPIGLKLMVVAEKTGLPAELYDPSIQPAAVRELATCLSMRSVCANTHQLGLPFTFTSLPAAIQQFIKTPCALCSVHKVLYNM